MLYGITVAPGSTLLAGRDDELMIAALGVEKQYNAQLAPAWDRALSEIVYYSDPNQMKKDAPHAFPVFLIDTPDVEGALGYHVRDYARVFVKPSFDLGSSILSGPYALSGVIAHEIFEAFGDLSCNFFAQMNDTLLTAIETCDAVESDPCPIWLDDGTQVMGSNFLLREWFDGASEAGPYDQLGTLKAPFTMTPGGYMIVEHAVAGSEQQVHASVLERLGAIEARPAGGGRFYLFGPSYPEAKKELKMRHGRHASRGKSPRATTSVDRIGQTR